MLEEVHISLPADAEAIAALKLGSVVYLDGIVYTAREGVYQRVLNEGHSLPQGLSEISNVNFHCSPAAAVKDDGTYEIGGVTATASFRFSKYLGDWLDLSGTKIIIGKGGRDISVERALDHIFGYACLVDVVIRGKEERVMRKSFDSFCPVGPWIATADEIADPANLALELRINGEVRQSANTANLIVDIQEGDLLIFPSRTEHATEPHDSAEPRISISADIMVTLKDSTEHEFLLPDPARWRKMGD